MSHCYFAMRLCAHFDIAHLPLLPHQRKAGSAKKDGKTTEEEALQKRF